MVWSRCSPSGSCQDTAIGSYPPSLSTDHSASRGSARGRVAAGQPRACAGTSSRRPRGATQGTKAHVVRAGGQLAGPSLAAILLPEHHPLPKSPPSCRSETAPRGCRCPHPPYDTSCATMAGKLRLMKRAKANTQHEIPAHRSHCSEFEWLCLTTIALTHRCCQGRAPLLIGKLEAGAYCNLGGLCEEVVALPGGVVSIWAGRRRRRCTAAAGPASFVCWEWVEGAPVLCPRVESERDRLLPCRS
eukprot:2436589-Prymnesium_polylepis.2